MASLFSLEQQQEVQAQPLELQLAHDERFTAAAAALQKKVTKPFITRF